MLCPGISLHNSLLIYLRRIRYASVSTTLPFTLDMPFKPVFHCTSFHFRNASDASVSTALAYTNSSYTPTVPCMGPAWSCLYFYRTSSHQFLIHTYCALNGHASRAPISTALVYTNSSYTPTVPCMVMPLVPLFLPHLLNPIPHTHLLCPAWSCLSCLYFYRTCLHQFLIHTYCAPHGHASHASISTALAYTNSSYTPTVPCMVKSKVVAYQDVPGRRVGKVVVDVLHRLERKRRMR